MSASSTALGRIRAWRRAPAAQDVPYHHSPSPAGAERLETGEWRVTLDVRARKVMVDEANVETELPMDDLVEIGVFAAAGDGGPPPYLDLRRVRSGEQRITVTVPWEPAAAGIDPRNLLIDVNAGDNVAEAESRPS